MSAIDQERDPFLEAFLTPADDEFRAELRGWLAAHLADHDPSRAPSSPGGTPEEDRFLREWQGVLHRDRWVGVGWPVEYGGRGASLLQEVIYERELAKAGAPPVLNAVGVNLVGPSLIAFGTAEQRARFLPTILSAEEVWCQGFSEPNAGSDLAAVTTKAVRNEGGWKISGTKIWTSFAHIARRCCLIARTSSGGSKHQGLTVFLADMEQPAITVSPIAALDGRQKLNEVYLDGAFASDADVLGEVDAGWSAVIRMLSQERVNVARLAFALPAQVRELIELRERLGEDDGLALPIVDYEIRTRAALLTYYRHLESQAAGEKVGAIGSADKLLCTELTKVMHEHAMKVTAEAGALWVNDGHRRHHDEYLTSFSKTIYGGTSEIQRNIVAERVLGLPADPKGPPRVATRGGSA